MNKTQLISNLTYGDQFGYAEMFEWGEVVDQNVSKISKFVQFSKDYPRAVVLAKDDSNILGVSSMSPAYLASNPDEWPYKYLFNEYGDLFLEEKTIAVGEKEYDSVNEFAYMSTSGQKIFSPIINPQYDNTKTYNKRTLRNEWVKVTILGKAIIEDNGKCKPGEYCTPYIGQDEKMYGTAIPCTDTTNVKFYVLERLSEHTILIYMTPKI